MRIVISTGDILLDGGLRQILESATISPEAIRINSPEHIAELPKDPDTLLVTTAEIFHIHFSSIPLDATLVITANGSSNVEELVKVGVGALVTLQEAPHQLEIALFMIHQHSRYFSPAITLGLIDNQTQRQSLSVLSTREMEIAELINQGMSNQTIAEKLFLSPQTIATHRKNIFRKLQVHSTTELRNKLPRIG
jgi:DNA-binding NarL/FixJ family response regulator